MIDIRCRYRQPVSGHGEAGRCQLSAGHEGPHAIMYCRAGHRTVRVWQHPDPADVRDHTAGQEPMPWVRGMPRPAWSEDA